jgi:hypothetical protein
LENVKVPVPITDDGNVDEDTIEKLYRLSFESVQNTLGRQIGTWVEPLSSGIRTRTVAGGLSASVDPSIDDVYATVQARLETA